jgi:hypothetical protein
MQRNLSPALRMLDRCRRHSPAWLAYMAKLEADLVEALRDPGPLIILPPGPRILPDWQLRRFARWESTGRMRSQVQRSLFAAGTVDSVLAAAEAAWRPRITMYRIDPGGTLTPVEKPGTEAADA